jgi:hypothetical protein
VKVYEQYCKLPVFVRWIFFLPISFISAVVLAWCLRFAVLFNDPGVSQIVIDLGFPVLCQSLFLGIIFYTVPKWKMGWVKSLFALRTIFSMVYIILGVVGFYHGVEGTSEWGYWKAGIAEVIVFFISLSVMHELNHDNLAGI